MDKYKKEKVIGSGTYGNVWLVRSKATDLPYVMKDVKLNTLDETERKRALAEVSILSKFKHKYIIKYKDAVIDRELDTLSIFMEYAFGGDLHTAIVKQKGVPFTDKIILSWFVQICLGLQYIHFQNIIHRDLKTQNIFLTRHNVIKIGDFGIARCLLESKELVLTAIGTPCYMSPEICQNKPYNFKSDIWALGCVLFEMVALTHPFKASNYANLVFLVVHGKRRDLPRHCSCFLQALVGMTLELKPEDRPSTSEILALPQLQPYLIGEVSTRVKSASVSDVMNLKFLRLSNRSSADTLKMPSTSGNRRASIAGGESRIPKSRLSIALKGKDIRISRFGAHRSQAKAARSPLPSSKKSSSKETKLLKPTKKEIIRSSSVSNTFVMTRYPLGHGSAHTSVEKQTMDLKHKNDKAVVNKEEVDCGYQSEDPFHTTSIKRGQFEINQDEAYIESPVKDLNSVAGEVVNKDNPMNMCNHDSHCQKCMIDMMWRNRILENENDLSKREELIVKLKTVFNVSFDYVYQTLVSEWKERSESVMKEMMDSLSYNKVRHLPLMVQLVQLDMVQKEKKPM